VTAAEPARYDVADRHWLVTGAAGFIGAHLCRSLLEHGASVVGLDNFDPYYDPEYKRQRVAAVAPTVPIHDLDLADHDAVVDLVAAERPGVVVNLAAQAGVRNSLDDPRSYVASNLVGFTSVLEACRITPPDHLVYASSSSVYGSTSPTPFAVDHAADHPLNLYAASKRANELMAHAYSQLFDLPCTGLRFFTVYGPWGRPDMAYLLFAEAITEGRPIRVFGDGSAARDFTYVDDIVDGVIATALRPPGGPTDPSGSGDDLGVSPIAPWRVLNIGHGQQVTVDQLITRLEQHLGRSAVREVATLQPGEAPVTHADVERLHHMTGSRPSVAFDQGVARFCAWYREWRGLSPSG
jgi:UDP-glucuronate 4-epimerase